MACRLCKQQAHLGTRSRGALVCRPWVPVSPQTRPEALDGKSSQRWGASPTPRAFYHSEA